MKQTAFSRAYAAWFADYTAERLRLKKRPGAKLPDFPHPPTCPEDIAAAVDQIGKARTLAVLGIHRSTLARWLAGTATIPRPSWLVLILLSEGRLPGMSSDWRDFRFDGDRLHLIGTRHSYSAREIAGWHYQTAHTAALSRALEAARSRTEYLLRIGDFEAQNDSLIHTG